MLKEGKLFLLSCAAAIAFSGASAQAGVPYPRTSTPSAVDQGELAAPLSVTVALHLPKLEEAEALLQSLSTKGDPQYHQFLTSEQFAARFAPADADVAKVIASFAKYGLSAERATLTTLKLSGSAANMQRAFAVSLHQYAVPASGKLSGYSYHAPLSSPTIPSDVAGVVAGVTGLDTRPSLKPRHVSAQVVPANKQASTANTSGELTVADFAGLYDVTPLYSKGISGKGRTLGIMTFANLTPSDVFAYWKAVGLSVDPKRLRVVTIDGGPGAPSDDSGSIETTLDVEQSGGIAPGANIVVYEGPNTDQAFVDVIAAAVDVNVADSLSISWGFWEYFYNLENSPVIDPSTGRKTSTLQAVHELLVRAALQGQSVFAAAGDGGAYDINNDLGCAGGYSPRDPSSCNDTLSVDYPASDPAITAAGGTTLPGVQSYCLNSACTPPYYDIDIPHERVWGWDYLNGLCVALGYPTPIDCGTFPGGGGGGVSIVWTRPSYQTGLAGTHNSQPGQVYEAGENVVSAAEVVSTYYKLPANFPGRNVPDISFNADPDTGYVIYYTSEPSGTFELETFYGGTSFVAPQLNGVTALLGQTTGGRLGLINYPLYESALFNRFSRASSATVHPIAYGDNWFYYGSNGYNPGAGLGTLDVANFAKFLTEF